MSLVFTMPGKMGDALLEWPVAHRYCVENDLKCTVWMDAYSMSPLVPLFEAQPVVEKVKLRPGITNYSMGGQPWDFGLSTRDHLDHEIVHLGMRKFPTRQITMETLESVPLRIKDGDALTQQPSLIVASSPANRVVLHGTFRHVHGQGVPTFWRFLSDIMGDLTSEFAEVVFVGTDAEVTRALEVYPNATGFQDGGNLLKSAELIAGSRLCIASGSVIAALGGALKVPTIRVHDPIGEHPKIIWSNLGPRQWNETEPELRRLWPQIKDEILAGVH